MMQSLTTAGWLVLLMSIAFVFGSPLQGQFEFTWFVFSAAGIAGAFSLVFLALFLVVFGPEGSTGELHIKLRPAALDHVLRKRRASRVSAAKLDPARRANVAPATSTTPATAV